MTTDHAVEDPQSLRMMAVLQESARKTGVRATADWLGVDRRTVLTCLSQGELTSRIRKALERELSSEATPEQTEIRDLAQRQDARIGDLESRVAGIAGDLDRLETALKAGREESAKGLRTLTRQVERLNTQGNPETFGGAARQPTDSGGVKSVATESGTGNPLVLRAPAPKIEPPQTPTRPWFPPRDYKDVVTIEPATDDSYVYGKAWPLVREWRMLRRGLPPGGKSLSWLKVEERLLVVEMALLDEHKLTLPPDKQPIDDFWRQHIMDWRRNDLHDIRTRIRRRKLLRWVRRLATFGAWWG